MRAQRINRWATSACNEHELVNNATRRSLELYEFVGAHTIPERFVVEVQEIGYGLVESPARVVVRGLDDQLENVHVSLALQVKMCLLAAHVILHVVVDEFALREQNQQS